VLGCSDWARLIGAAALPRVREKLSWMGWCVAILVLQHDICFGTGADIYLLCVVMLVAGVLGLDSGVFECGGADNVSVVFASASVVDVTCWSCRAEWRWSDLVGSGPEADRSQMRWPSQRWYWLRSDGAARHRITASELEMRRRVRMRADASGVLGRSSGT